MTRFTMSPPESTVQVGLFEDSDGVNLQVQSGDNTQYVCCITPQGELKLFKLGPRTAERLGLSIDEKHYVSVVYDD